MQLPINKPKKLIFAGDTQKSTVSPVVLTDSNDNRLFIEIIAAGCRVKALLDSGAQMSLINRSFLSKVGVPFSTKNLPSVVSADNSPIQILGTVSLSVYFNGSKVPHNFLVVDNVTSNMILGIEFWNRFGLTTVLSRAFDKEIKENLYMPDPNIVDSPFCVSEARFIQARKFLTPDQEIRLQEVISEFEEISSVKIGLGKTSWLTHKIETTGPPIRQRYYPLSPAKLKILNEEIDKMLEAGVIRPSRSPWASPVVMVTKKDGSVRFCVDSRKLNSVTVRDSYPLPRIQDILDNLRGAKYMTSLDFRSAFWQIPLHDKDSCEKTAFIVPQRGLFEFVRMPFGLTNAASEMQRLTDMIVNYEFTGLSDDCVFGYVDDLILVSRDFDSHILLIRKVLNRLKQAGLSVNLEKCEFCKPELKYLGYIVNENGLQTDPKKLEAIDNYPVPNTAKSLRAFIGMCSYYRRFVVNFSTIIAPLTALIGKKKGRDCIEWNPDAQDAFSKLKKELMSSPLMACPDFSKPFLLQCDASAIGVGSVLSQKIGGIEHPIAFYSRLLTKPEKNYGTTERELLAVLESIKHFRGYLDGMKFTIITDHIALKWLLTLDNPSGRLARWATQISQFNFDIEHRKGVLNIVPDCLSRPQINLITYNEGVNNTTDRWYKKIFLGVRNNPQMFPAYSIQQGVLMRRMPLDSPLHGDPWRIVLPADKTRESILEAHNNPPSIHPGTMKTYLLLKKIYYWPNMYHDISEVLRDCSTCKAHKISNTKPRGRMLYPKSVTLPLQMISIDLIGPLPLAYYGYKYILTMVDVFSKYVWLVPLKKIDAKGICNALEKEIFLIFGVPTSILCDNATVFHSNFFSRFLRSYNIGEPYFTPFYSPQANTVEKYNQSVVTCLSILVEQNHRSWARLLPKVKLYLNSCINLATSYSPNFLMFGRDVIVDDRQSRENQSLGGDIAERRVDRASRLSSLNEVFAKVADNLSHAFLANSRRYNRNRVTITLQTGEVVWRKNFTRSTGNDFFSGKLAPRFTRCVVSRVISNQVYELKDCDSSHVGTYHIKDILK